jgi:ribulose-5-phosphate 4-epimerase/fuculose-1-phosphate aldolase
VTAAPVDEQRTREDLAALYRLVAHFRMTDLIDTHISARVPGTEDQFLINRYGVLFHEMRPQDLVRIDGQGQVLEDHDGTPPPVNAAGFTIHSAVHAARHDITCVVHTHTADGMAVSALEEGLLPLTQHALKFHGCLSYHAYEGIALDLDERERLVHDLGPTNHCMILRNHGLLAGGRTIPEAFVNIYYLERACQAQVKALSSGRPLILPTAAVQAKTAAQYEAPGALGYCDLVWQAALRLL